MTVFRPSTLISSPAQRLTGAEAAVVYLRISLGRNGPHDALEIVASRDSKLGDLNAGDPIEVALGEQGSEQAVWSGEVVRLSRGEDSLSLEGLAKTAVLSRRRKSQTYLSQSIADIVRDLASEVTISDVQADLVLEAYAVDDRRTIWDHVVELARLANADLVCAADGGLRFVAVRGGAPELTLRHGADLVKWRMGRRTAAPLTARTAQRAASESGSDKWHWLLRTPPAKTAPVRAVPAFSTRDAADQFEQGSSERLSRRTLLGEAWIAGRSEPRAGSLVRLFDLPEGAYDCRVLGVEHLLSAHGGWLTRLALEGAAAAGGGP